MLDGFVQNRFLLPVFLQLPNCVLPVFANGFRVRLQQTASVVGALHGGMLSR
jgi:hypothetical protein